VTWPTYSGPPKIFYKKDKLIKRQKTPRRKKKRKKVHLFHRETIHPFHGKGILLTHFSVFKRINIKFLAGLFLYK
jgi:hypothetical protein